MKIYSDNIIKYDAKLLLLTQKLKQASLLRLFTFLGFIGVLISLFYLKLFTAFFIAIPISILGFGYVLKHHGRLAFLKTHTAFLKRINECEILRLNNELEAFDSGEKFINPNHPYSSDLDIFGQHSIFQLVNRTTTESGEIRLSEWLSKPANKAEILNRQHAIKTLSKKLDWRQNFQASGMHYLNKKSNYADLLHWVEQPLVLLKKQPIYRLIALVSPILFFISTYFFYLNLGLPTAFLHLTFMIVVLGTNYLIINKLKNLSEAIVETSSANLETLHGYLSLIKNIETESFEAKKLQDLQAKLTQGNYSAHHEIKQLCSLLEYAQQRPIKKIPIGGNYMYPLLNSILLLDIYLILGTEKWKLKNKAMITTWADVISEFEAINSFAGFHYSNPTYSFPVITDTQNYVYFEALGHPLLEHTKRVCNDFHSEEAGDVIMITGSNMAGKSTFLRAVGVNIVLALAGAPCCAVQGNLSILQLYSSMRIADNLQKGISSFFAELKRIESLLKLIETNNNVFFLIDEMFKGTNSEDRHLGGFSFINQVSKLNTSGVIATHDIELAKRAGNQDLVRNYSFNSEIKNEAMIFNYKLDAMICHDFNASALMKRSGIKIISEPK
ncbi:MutS-related protein [Formosa haliotis]|uniref:MutS-related protein n=1 Tax=Formosa haliotis TaxID=1555194 RepID=UPI0008251AC8|nr:DNA mismatch repair protein MutS [Formosa haliotis]